MPGAKKCRHALPALFLFLLFSPGAPGVEGSRAETNKSRARDLQGLPRDRRILLQLLHRALQDRSRRQLDSDFKDQFIQHFIEVFTGDSALKEKVLEFFSGSIALSAECTTLFYRAYHNTRDCSTQSYYKRCARMLTRIAASPPCTQ